MFFKYFKYKYMVILHSEFFYQWYNSVSLQTPELPKSNSRSVIHTHQVSWWGQQTLTGFKRWFLVVQWYPFWEGITGISTHRSPFLSPNPFPAQFEALWGQLLWVLWSQTAHRAFPGCCSSTNKTWTAKEMVGRWQRGAPALVNPEMFTHYIEIGWDHGGWKRNKI